MTRKRSSKNKNSNENTDEHKKKEEMPANVDNDSAYNDDYEFDDDMIDGVQCENEAENTHGKRKLDEVDCDESVPMKKKNNVSNKQAQHKYIKPPSVDELKKFREIQFLQHSNLFRMQMEEMLSTLEIKQKTKVKINSWLSDFTKFVKSLSNSDSYSLIDFDWIKEQGIDFPMKDFQDLPKLKGTFRFLPPHEVTLIGSFPLNLATTHSRTVDVALVLPKEFMHHSDLSKGKWLLRRALYLSWIGLALKESKDLVSSVSWTCHLGSSFRPTLQVKTAAKYRSSWTFNLFPVPSKDYFKIGTITPIKNNVNPNWYFQRERDEGNLVAPTPHHNWLCGIDVVMISHHSYIDENLKHPNWIQGVKILKIWLTQRKLNQGEGAITSHMINLLVIYLAKSRKISPQMSPYQVFRTTLLYLSQTDWQSEGPTLSEAKKGKDFNLKLLTPSDFHPLYSVVFVDPTGFLNIMGDVSAQTYHEFLHEAKTGLEILELSSTNSFEALFIERVEFNMKFDQLLHIELDIDLVSTILEDKKNSTTLNPEIILVDRLGDIRAPIHFEVISIISKALGDRVDLIGQKRNENRTWSYGCPIPGVQCSLTLGLLVNPINSVGLLTKGPSANTNEVTEFREFWGEISCLRRFRDSTFHEAVLWLESTDPVGDRRLIIGAIASYILERHFSIQKMNIHYVARQLEDVLRKYYVYEGEEDLKYGTGEEAISTAIVSFDKLSKKLRSLDLPLQITGIQSSSDVIKHGSVYPPLPTRVPKPYLNSQKKTSSLSMFSPLSDEHTYCPLYRPSIDVQISLEISGKWPDDLLAIRAIKCEFMCKIANQLKENGITAVVFPTHLSIIWEGYIFNLKVCYRREIYILRSFDSKGVIDAESAAEASLQLEMEIDILPKLTSAFSSLQSDFPTYSGAVRLVRRWVSSQLFVPHFPPTVINLLVAHLYITPHPYKAPNSPHVALLRFMDFMSKTDWKTTPLFVNLRNLFEANDETELTKRFTGVRHSFPALFICSPCELRPLAGIAEPTNEDLNKRFELASCWSSKGPTLPILSRMKVVASAGLDVYTIALWEEAFDFKVLFRPPLDDYDVLITLDGSRLTRGFERVDRKKKFLKRYEHSKGEILPAFDFDPVRFYLKELRASFGAHALFFHDEFGGNVIGVVWKPHVYTEKEAKMGSLEGHKLFGIREVKQIVNVDSIVEEFAILGKGIVEEVQLKR